jgi:hypothetical protein
MVSHLQLRTPRLRRPREVEFMRAAVEACVKIPADEPGAVAKARRGHDELSKLIRDPSVVEFAVAQ